jgi:hypothetical protein
VEDALAAAIRQKVASIEKAKRAIRHQSLAANATKGIRNEFKYKN